MIVLSVSCSLMGTKSLALALGLWRSRLKYKAIDLIAFHKWPEIPIKFSVRGNNPDVGSKILN